MRSDSMTVFAARWRLAHVLNLGYAERVALHAIVSRIRK